jgi:hypothetical protein
MATPPINLADAIVGLRHANATLEATLARDHARLSQVEATAQAAEKEHTLVRTPEAPLPSPEQEGWWPEDRLYIYLPKALLPKVRFRDRGMSAREFLAQSKAPDGPEVELPAEVEAHLASAPEALDDGRRIVARMPVLSVDVEPLVEATQARLEQTLGLTRAGILKEQASRFNNENLDGLGSVQREFLVSDDGNLYVRYVDPWGNRYFRNRSYNIQERNSAFQHAWDYGHLFGPGGPLDLLQ